MAEVVSILLVGIGGYGNTYIDALLNYIGKEKFYIAGVVDPNPERCPNLPKLRELGIPIYNNKEDFYRDKGADLAVISSPIQYHCPQTCFALSNGSNVLCEKPIVY